MYRPNDGAGILHVAVQEPFAKRKWERGGDETRKWGVFSELGSQVYKYSIAPSESSRQKLNVCLARTSFASSAWLRSILQRMISVLQVFPRTKILGKTSEERKRLRPRDGDVCVCVCGQASKEGNLNTCIVYFLLSSCFCDCTSRS
jgi:hypothetical protein